MQKPIMGFRLKLRFKQSSSRLQNANCHNRAWAGWAIEPKNRADVRGQRSSCRFPLAVP